MFWKETAFKETSIGRIPKAWNEAKLEDVAEYINGYHFSPKDWKEKGLPIIRIQNLNDVNAEFNYFDGEIEDKYVIENGDLLFSWSASIGAYIWNRGKAVLNQHIFKVIPRNCISKSYLFYALFLAIEQLKSRIHGSTMKHFKKQELQTRISLPSLSEQERIAEVLSCVDLAIQKTGEVIAKTERLKKGLMQKLLTKGIGHKEFKDTEIGKIPKTWEIGKLGQVLSDIRYGTSLRANTDNQGVPVLGTPNVLGGKIDETDLRYVVLPEKKQQSLTLKGGDILLVRTNANPEYIGRCALFGSRKGVWVFASYLIRIRPKMENVVPEYLVKYLQSEKARNQFLSIARTSAGNYNINTKGLQAIRICVPNKNEQKRIAEVLSVVDTKLELEERERTRLERIKQGLMDLLLTGKVRVRVD